VLVDKSVKVKDEDKQTHGEERGNGEYGKGVVILSLDCVSAVDDEVGDPSNLWRLSLVRFEIRRDDLRCSL
jgi:hypothetical protein